jgi:hypothetical protein
MQPWYGIYRHRKRNSLISHLFKSLYTKKSTKAIWTINCQHIPSMIHLLPLDLLVPFFIFLRIKKSYFLCKNWGFWYLNSKSIMICLWESHCFCHVYLSVCNKSLYICTPWSSYILKGNASKLCMLAFYPMKIQFHYDELL